MSSIGAGSKLGPHGRDEAERSQARVQVTPMVPRCGA